MALSNIDLVLVEHPPIHSIDVPDLRCTLVIGQTEGGELSGHIYIAYTLYAVLNTIYQVRLGVLEINVDDFIRIP